MSEETVVPAETTPAATVESQPPASTDAAPATPTIEQLQKQLDAYKGIDVEKVKMTDAEYQKAKAELEQLKNNPEVQKILNAPKLPETAEQRLERLEKEWKAEKDSQAQAQQKQTYDAFMSDLDKTIDATLKEAKVSLVTEGQNEREWLIDKTLNQLAEKEKADMAKGLPGKVPTSEEVKTALKTSLDQLVKYRRAISASQVRSGIPQGGKPASSTTTKEPKFVEQSDRLAAIKSDMAAFRSE